jgi:DnaB-like helicase N terminal domain/AAA domain
VSHQRDDEGAVPPQNLDAEEYVLGAILRAGADGLEASKATVEAIRSTRLTADDFYRTLSHGPIYEAALALAEQGQPTDAISVVAELERRGQLENVKGTVRVHELAALCPAVSNAPHHARLIREAAERREERDVGQALTEAAWNGGVAAHPEVAERVRRVLDGRPSDRRLEGVSHAEALKAEIPEVGELVEGVIDLGTVGAIVGLPYARKSWACQELARKVAAASGLLFGKFPVLAGGPVVYCWQDDSTAKMLERVQARPDEPELPIRWLLNEGVRLPDDLPALREIVERDQAVLVVFDSLYNFLPVDVKLKDEDVAPILTALKSELCDRTGATVAIADHAPWPNEANRGQRRAYGSVFKTAAVRWHLHLETDGKDDTRLHIEARGNNVAGLPRTPAYWDEEAHEIRLLEPDRVNEKEIDELVLAYVTGHPGASTTAVREGVKGRSVAVDSSLERLKGRDEVVDLDRKGGTWSGQPGTPRYWYPSNHAVSTPSQLFGTRSDEVGAAVPKKDDPVPPSHPRRGDGVERDGVENGRAQDATDTFSAREGLP